MPLTFAMLSFLFGSSFQQIYILIFQFWHFTSVDVRLPYRFSALLLWMLSSLLLICKASLSFYSSWIALNFLYGIRGWGLQGIILIQQMTLLLLSSHTHTHTHAHHLVSQLSTTKDKVIKCDIPIIDGVAVIVQYILI